MLLLLLLPLFKIQGIMLEFIKSFYKIYTIFTASADTEHGESGYFFYVFNFVSTILNQCQKCYNKINISTTPFFSRFYTNTNTHTQKMYFTEWEAFEVGKSIQMDTNPTSIFLNRIYTIYFFAFIFQRNLFFSFFLEDKNPFDWGNVDI